MPVRYGFQQSDGTTLRPVASDLTDVQYAFTLLSGAIGMPVLDEKTIDEFTRRADLYQKYIGNVLSNSNGPMVFTRADFETLMPGAWTNWTKVGKRDFDIAMKREKAAYEASVQKAAAQ